VLMMRKMAIEEYPGNHPFTPKRKSEAAYYKSPAPDS
jgi:hypothetical protein